MDVIFFEIRGRRCALPVATVRQVAAPPHVTPVPSTPPAVRGVSPVKGEVLPLIDLGVWLSPSSDPRTDASWLRTESAKILVIECLVPPWLTPVRAALAVDRVTRLGTIDETHCRPAPAGPTFVTSTVLDVEGPALLLDPSLALEQIRQAFRAVVPTS